MPAEKSWVEQTADLVEQRVIETRGRDAKITCASGISPSGPVHLGNLREIITVHLVTEELKLRGWQAEHIHSWDDFDRLRKVPSSVPDPQQFAAHVGKPLADVPDPFGEYPSYAERYKDAFESAMLDLGIAPRFISQAQAYRRGDYVPQMKAAMAHRFEIFDILANYQTLDHFEKSSLERREAYFPVRVYCETCGRDDTAITRWEPETATIQYTCLNGHAGQFSLDEKSPCKLVWKVDWPMRWAYEQVDFEPAGEDHAAPGSSYTVGQQIVREIYNFLPPVFIGYAFVGMAGRSKMSSSSGSSPTPRAALDILEPSILRWLYLRRSPNQKFNIDFGQEVIRLYDEWDSFASRQANSATDQKIYQLCTHTSVRPIRRATQPISFRLLSSAADITQGSRTQILRIAADSLNLSADQPGLAEALEPRLSCAIRWATEYLPEDERTTIRAAFDPDAYAQLDATSQAGIALLLERMEENWSLEGLTSLVYAVPKLLLNLPADAKPTEALKQAQRQFFIGIYRLVCASDTGPRLPTLFLSLGQDKVRQLLAP